jgi:hypothetical protein
MEIERVYYDIPMCVMYMRGAIKVQDTAEYRSKQYIGIYIYYVRRRISCNVSKLNPYISLL